MISRILFRKNIRIKICLDCSEPPEIYLEPPAYQILSKRRSLTYYQEQKQKDLVPPATMKAPEE